MGITLITLPKPFRDSHIKRIQTNALKSWRALSEKHDVEIIVFGDEFGIEEVCSELGLRNVKDVERTSLGTPLLSSMFEQAYALSTYDTICYVNADIVFFDDFIESVEAITLERFMAVGQRINVDVEEDLEFGSKHSAAIKERLVRSGELMFKGANDYFIFKKELIREKIIPLAVGRPGWDSWFIYHAVRSGFHLVDTTHSCQAIHQNHGYGHVPKARGSFWAGEEGDENLRLIDADQHRKTVFTMKDAKWVVKNGKMKRAIGMEYWVPTLNHLDFYIPALRPIYKTLRSFF